MFDLNLLARLYHHSWRLTHLKNMCSSTWIISTSDFKKTTPNFFQGTSGSRTCPKKASTPSVLLIQFLLWSLLVLRELTQHGIDEAFCKQYCISIKKTNDKTSQISTSQYLITVTLNSTISISSN